MPLARGSRTGQRTPPFIDLRSIPGLLTWIDSTNTNNIVASAKYTTAKDLSGNGNDWTNASVAGIPQTSVTVQYPDVAGNQMVSLPNINAFDVTDKTARMLRCANVMTGLTDWTVVTVYRTQNYDSVSDNKNLYWLDNGAVVDSSSNGVSYFYNGTTFGTNSNGPVLYTDPTMWRVVVQSYQAPRAGTTRHFIMQNGLPAIIGGNSLGVIDSDPTSANYRWAIAAHDYVARTDYAHLAIGSVQPVTLATTTHKPCFVIKTMALYNRALNFAEASQVTAYLLGQVYGNISPFMRVLHCMGDSLHQQSSNITCTNGFYWQDLSAVKKAATIFFNTAEGGNSIELQGERAAQTAGQVRKHRYLSNYVCNIDIGTNNPSDSAATKWSKLKTLLSNSLYGGAVTHLNVATLIACGTNATTPDLTRSSNHDLFNQVMRPGIQSGGDFNTAYPHIQCGLLEYATAIPTNFTVAIAVMDPSTASTTFNKKVSDTTPADVTNGSLQHYQASALHPVVTTRPYGTAPIMVDEARYEVVKTKMDAILF